MEHAKSLGFYWTGDINYDKNEKLYTTDFYLSPDFFVWINSFGDDGMISGDYRVICYGSFNNPEAAKQFMLVNGYRDIRFRECVNKNHPITPGFEQYIPELVSILQNKFRKFQTDFEKQKSDLIKRNLQTSKIQKCVSNDRAFTLIEYDNLAVFELTPGFAKHIGYFYHNMFAGAKLCESQGCLIIKANKNQQEEIKSKLMNEYAIYLNRTVTVY